MIIQGLGGGGGGSWLKNTMVRGKMFMRETVQNGDYS